MLYVKTNEDTFIHKDQFENGQPLELIDVINVMSFLLQVGFMLFYYKRLKCKQFRLLTYIEESFKRFIFLRVTPVYH